MVPSARAVRYNAVVLCNMSLVTIACAMLQRAVPMFNGGPCLCLLPLSCHDVSCCAVCYRR